MLTTHLLSYIFQHTLFDLLKFTWVSSNYVGPIWIWWVSYVF